MTAKQRAALKRGPMAGTFYDLLLKMQGKPYMSLADVERAMRRQNRFARKLIKTL